MESLIWNDLCGFIKRHFFNGKINWSFLYCVYWLGKRVLLHWKEAICHLSITQLQIRWAKTKNPICCVFHAIVILVTSCCQPGQRGWPNQALNFKRLILEAGECVKPFSFLSQNLLVRTSCMVLQTNVHMVLCFSMNNCSVHYTLDFRLAFADICIRYALKKNYGIIWEFFPSGGPPHPPPPFWEPLIRRKKIIVYFAF